MKLYAAIANALCIKLRQETLGGDLLSVACNVLPQGSGFDSEPEIAYSPWPDGSPRQPKGEYLIHGSYHRMQDGLYDGWLDFTIRVYAQENFLTPWDIEVISPYETSDENLIDFILDCYAEALNQEMPDAR